MNNTDRLSADVESSFTRRKSEVRILCCPPSTNDFPLEQFGLRELLESLLDKSARRRLQIRTMTNEQLLSEYTAELRLKLSPGQFPQYLRTLNDFFDFCGGLPPNRQLAVAYLNKFKESAPATRRRYYNIIKGLFTSDSGLADRDFNISMPNPKPLPQVVTDEEFYKLIGAMGCGGPSERTFPATNCSSSSSGVPGSAEKRRRNL